MTATTVAPATRRFAALLLLIAAVGLAGRAGYVLLVVQDQELPPPLGQGTTGATRSFDEIYYINGADALVSGEGFRFGQLPGNARVFWEDQAEHPPLMNLFLAPVHAATGGSETAMRLWTVLAGAGVIVVVGLLGRELAGDRAGLIAAGIAAVYPGLWLSDGLILSESLATLLVISAVYATYRALKRESWLLAIVVGVLAGLAALTRGELALLTPLLVIAVGVGLRAAPAKRRVMLAAVVLVASGLTVAPWIAFNHARFEKGTTLSFSGGGVIDGANCDSTYSGDLIGFWNGLCRPKPKEGDGSEISDAQLRRGLEYMGDHLDRLPVVMAARVGRLLGVFKTAQVTEFGEKEGRPQALSIIGLVMSWVLIGFAVAGTVALVRRKVPVLPVLAPIIVVLVSTALTYGSLRLRAPAEPALVVLGAVGIAWLLERRTATSAAPVPASR